MVSKRKSTKGARKRSLTKAKKAAIRAANAGANNKIKEWRLWNNMTPEDLAKATGLSRPTISRLESGARVYRQEHLEMIAEIFGCTPADLISIDPAEMADIFKIYGGVAAALLALKATLK